MGGERETNDAYFPFQFGADVVPGYPVHGLIFLKKEVGASANKREGSFERIRAASGARRLLSRAGLWVACRRRADERPALRNTARA